MASVTSTPSHRSRRLPGARGLLVSIQESAQVRDVVLLVVRLSLAWVFMYHGAGKLFNFKHQGGITGTTMFFHLEGIPAAHFMAYVVGLTEFAGGLALLVGFAVPLVGIALVIDMLVAIVTTTGATGMLPKALPGGQVGDGFEINLALAALALVVALLGAGRLSADRALGLTSRQDR